MVGILEKLIRKDNEKGVNFHFLVSESSLTEPLEKIKIQLFKTLPRYYDHIQISFELDEDATLKRITIACADPTSRFKQEGRWKIFYDIYNLYVPNILQYLESVGVKAICSVEHLKD